MAQNTIADLSETFSSNTDFLGQSMQGSADANTIDTIFQKYGALLRRFYSDLGGIGTVGGSANGITYTSASTYTSLITGLVVAFKAASSNTGAATFKLDSLDVKDIKVANDTDIVAGNIIANGVYLVRYDETLDGGSTGAWVLLNPSTPGKGVDVASATLVELGEGSLFHITGTTTITDIDFLTPFNGRRATLVFDGILTLTYHATTLKLPGGADITTAAGDRCVVVQDSSDNVIVESYTRANGFPIRSGYEFVKKLTASASATLDFDTSNDVTIESGYDYIISCVNIQPAADAYLMLRFGTGATPTYQTTNYTGMVGGYNASGASGQAGTTGGIQLQFTTSPGGAVAGETIEAEVTIPDPGTSMIHKCLFQGTNYDSAGAITGSSGSGWRTTAEAITGLRLMMSTNNITSGYACLFRRKLS